MLINLQRTPEGLRCSVNSLSLQRERPFRDDWALPQGPPIFPIL